jgi:hypothetical protein
MSKSTGEDIRILEEKRPGVRAFTPDDWYVKNKGWRSIGSLHVYRYDLVMVTTCAPDTNPSLWALDPDLEGVYTRLDAWMRFHDHEAIVKLNDDDPDPPLLEIGVAWYDELRTKNEGFYGEIRG